MNDNQDISWRCDGDFDMVAFEPRRFDAAHPLNRQNVLVTGGSGAFGKAFVKKALAEGARRVVVFSRSESKQAEMRSEINDSRVRYAIGDVRDLHRITDACRDVDIVIHAAALKRVEVCEENPWEAINSNVIGTENVARACIAAKVRQAIFLSTDKSAGANTVYGASKFAAERLWLGSNIYSAGTQTRFSATRYGNVSGSTGSVIPVWKAQRESGVITVTDKSMTRFLMSMDEAVDLVCLALKNMRGGDLFIPKLRRARLLDLAAIVAPGCAIREIGIRPGEKLHETLITEDESRSTFDCDSHYVIEPETRLWGKATPLPYPKVPVGFTYRSDTVDDLPASELERLAA